MGLIFWDNAYKSFLSPTYFQFTVYCGCYNNEIVCVCFLSITGKFPSEKHKDEKIHFPLTLAMEMRVMKKSDTLLCPASIAEGGEPYIAYIEVLSVSGTPGYEQYFTDVALAWKKLGGIPHWQKQWTFLKDKDPEDPDIFGYIRKKYGENIKTFMNVRQQLNLDPKNLFMNRTMAQVFHSD